MNRIGYKWWVHLRLMKDPVLRASLPRTVLYSPETFRQMLARHKSLILKPSGGSQGVGVILITGREDGSRIAQIHKEVRVFRDTPSLTAWADAINKRSETRYLIQQCIPLARLGGKLFTIRTITQRKPGRPWVLTGWVAKTAGPGHFITNSRSGGGVHYVEQALSQSNVRRPSESVLKDLRNLTMQAAQILGKWEPRQPVIGFDLGVDTNGHVWMIEANPEPGFGAFRRLDPNMYRRIIQF
ncbi:YheC/YheD family protein [Staphylospora marina]|uniref:YheC/YheD family protein n=1 Tax=Staphylospora marina TaxID=2490858 RepID=UPI0013DE6459|nr:YheC/YheD family protein [Staphylospora marina]